MSFVRSSVFVGAHLMMKFLMLGASLGVWLVGATGRAENVGIGVLEPQAVLHVKGETGSNDDVIFQNMDAHDGTANSGNVLVVDGDIRATGNIYSGNQFLASNFFQTSDRRLKTYVLALAVRQLDEQNTALAVALEAERAARIEEQARLVELETVVMLMKAQLDL